MMENVSKWFLCFRPPATIEIDDGVDCSADRVLSLIAAARNSNRLNKKKKKQEKKKSPKTKVLESSNPDHHPPPRTSRRSFSSVIKAVVFETSLSRRVRESKSRNRSDQSVRIPPSDQELFATAVRTTSEQKSTIAADLKSDSNRTEKHTSAPPASDFRFTSVSENSKQSVIGAGSAVRINPVVCLILLSLWVTVFWGRACAVMTTTLGIYAWQSGVVVVGLGEMLKLKKDKKKRAGAAIEEGGEIEKGTDNFSAKGNKLIERGLIGN